MQFNAVNVFFVCIGIAAVFYILYYWIFPLFACGVYLSRHYVDSKYQNGCFWVKLKKEDKDYFVYNISMKGMKIYNCCWQMYDKHKEAYHLYLEGRKADEQHND